MASDSDNARYYIVSGAQWHGKQMGDVYLSNWLVIDSQHQQPVTDYVGLPSKIRSFQGKALTYDEAKKIAAALNARGKP